METIEIPIKMLRHTLAMPLRIHGKPLLRKQDVTFLCVTAFNYSTKGVKSTFINMATDRIKDLYARQKQYLA